MLLKNESDKKNLPASISREVRMTYMLLVLYLMNVAVLCSQNSSVKSAMSFNAFAVQNYLTKHYFNVSHLNQAFCEIFILVLVSEVLLVACER